MLTQRVFLNQQEAAVRRNDWGFYLQSASREERMHYRRTYPWVDRLFEQRSKPVISHYHSVRIELDLNLHDPVTDESGTVIEELYFINGRGEAMFYELPSLIPWHKIFPGLFKEPCMNIHVRLMQHQSVRDFIDRLGESAEDIQYILSYSKHTLHCIIYEPPSGYTVLQWFAELNRDSQQALRAAVRQMNDLCERHLPIDPLE